MAPAWLWAVVLVTGCATTPAQAPRFTYAPRAGTRYVRTVRMVSEITVIGTPVRQREEQEFVWNVAFARQGSNTLVTHQLQRLSVRINDAVVLDAERAPGEGISVDLLVSPEPRVLEVRGTERAAELLSSLRVDLGDRSGVAIGPDEVRRIAVALFEMVIRDVVNRPSESGSTWTAADPDPAVERKTMSVDRLEACGPVRCARVTAQYEVSPQAALPALDAATTVLAGSGMNPSQADLLDTTVDYHDEVLLEPGTLVDHAASFSRTIRVTFVGPQGAQVPVEFRTRLEQSSAFP
ncbi:MAG TPA: hypothetical protein VFN91_06950 [Myxococcaceae bacterium]|nr:hypothetical protein [Myxococcaceae bacterium]